MNQTGNPRTNLTVNPVILQHLVFFLYWVIKRTRITKVNKLKKEQRVIINPDLLPWRITGPYSDGWLSPSAFFFSPPLLTENNVFETRVGKMREQKLKFHYLLRSALGAQLVSAPCGPEIFTASAYLSFIVALLFPARDAFTCSLPLAFWDTVDNYNLYTFPRFSS